MHIMIFTERPYYHVPEDEIIKNASYFGISNTHFDPVKGSALYNEYFDEALYAEEQGFDGVMLNEHHGTPFSMGAVMDVEAAVLARITKRLKIVLMGNPLPVADPIRLAEELAMIDLISGGRLVPGWVRGSGTESLHQNANPAFNRERFNEAHDLVIKAWTTPGPFRYEGKHYHYRHVNPWVLPLQKPHPPIWIPGVSSPETAVWCAKHRYPYLALAAFLEPTAEIWNLYADVAAQEGYQAGPENFGYLQEWLWPRRRRRPRRSAEGICMAVAFTPLLVPSGSFRPATIPENRRAAWRVFLPTLPSAPRRPPARSRQPGGVSTRVTRRSKITARSFWAPPIALSRRSAISLRPCGRASFPSGTIMAPSAMRTG